MFGHGTTKLSTRRPTAWLAAVVLSMLAPGAVLAASPQCLQLAGELERLTQASGNFQPGEYAVAAETQRDQIDLARIRAADLGCGRAISNDMIAECAALNAKIAEMENNLGKLVGAQAVRPSRNAQRERIRVLDAMELAGCNDPVAEEEETTTDIDPLDLAPDELDQQIGGTIIRGGSQESFNANEDYPQHIIVGRSLQPGTGDYRTLCVRTCDGYFFPMSNAASLSDFQRDQKSCEASCPGTEIELFYHQPAFERQEDMVSARSGQPYGNMPTAYRYKRVDLPRVQSCGCNLAKNRDFSILAGEGRPIPGTGKAAPAVEAAPAPVVPRAPADPDRKVRAVGPAFLPDPPAATDLRAPGPTPAR